MPTFGVIALIGGRLIASGLACGLNLYATIALVGLASRFGWIQLPPGLLGLGQWLLIGGATALFAAEIIAAAVPIVDALWEASHTIIRPVAAGALAFGALEAAPTSLRVTGAAISALAALASHSAKVGLRLVATRRRSKRFAISAAEDVAAIALAVAALVAPALAALASLIFALILLRFGPGLWRAFAFAARAGIAALRGFFGTRRWRARDELPAAFRSHVPPPEVGLPEPKTARASLHAPGSGPWLNGWLVLDGRSAFFLYRGGLSIRRVSLPRPDDPVVRHGLLADAIAWRHEDAEFTLHVLRDGPSAEIIVGAIQLAIR